MAPVAETDRDGPKRNDSATRRADTGKIRGIRSPRVPPRSAHWPPPEWQAILAGSLRPERNGGDTFRRMVVVGDHDPEPTDDASIVMSPADKVHLGHRLSKAGIELFKRVAANRDGTEPLLRQESGTAWKPSTYQRPFKAALVEAKVKAIAFHELRHSYATALLRNGAPPVVVAEALGHSDLHMVTKHYGHIPVSFASETIRRGS